MALQPADCVQLVHVSWHCVLHMVWVPLHCARQPPLLHLDEHICSCMEHIVAHICAIIRQLCDGVHDGTSIPPPSRGAPTSLTPAS